MIIGYYDDIGKLFWLFNTSIPNYEPDRSNSGKPVSYCIHIKKKEYRVAKECAIAMAEELKEKLKFPKTYYPEEKEN